MHAEYASILTILTLNGMILLAPGANFILIMRYATSYGRKIAMYCAIGITSAIMLHVFLAYIFVDILFKNSPVLFGFIKYVGVAFLIYLSWKMFQNSKITPTKNSDDIIKKESGNSFVDGLLIDLLNPFISIFYVSLFSSIATPSSTSFDAMLYILIIFTITILWFLFVAFFFSATQLRRYFSSKHKIIHQLSSCAFLWFAYKLATTYL